MQSKFRVLIVRITQLSVLSLILPASRSALPIVVGLNHWVLHFLAYCSYSETIARFYKDGNSMSWRWSPSSLSAGEAKAVATIWERLSPLFTLWANFLLPIAANSY